MVEEQNLGRELAHFWQQEAVQKSTQLLSGGRGGCCCWMVSIGSRPELGEGRSYEEYLGLDILIMEEERLYLLL